MGYHSNLMLEIEAEIKAVYRDIERGNHNDDDFEYIQFLKQALVIVKEKEDSRIL